MVSVRTKLDKFKPRSRGIRYFVTYLTLIVGTIMAKINVRGRHHLPKQGPFILAINHFSPVDPAFVVYAVRRPINFLAASDHVIEWYNFWAVWLYGFIPTNRTKLAPSTIKDAVRVLRRKDILGIFPEGTSTSDVLRPAKNGVVYFSTVTAAPIVPVSVLGLNDAWGQWLKGVRPKVTIRFGKPFGHLQVSGNRKEREQILAEIGHEVMCHIAALLPKQNQGEFQGDPLIEQVIEENN